MIRSVRTGKVPFQFDIADLLARARRQASGRLGDVTLNLPFVSFSVSLKDQEQQVAREIVIRIKDRRVLSAWECCDNCIDHALTSLQEIRSTLVDKQVELSSVQDGPLYLLIDAMTSGIRQFLTYEELLKGSNDFQHHPRFSEFRRPPDVRQAYFEALEILRGHLSRCLGQIAVIAGMDVPAGGLSAHYVGPWQVEAYVAQELPVKSSPASTNP